MSYERGVLAFPTRPGDGAAPTDRTADAHFRGAEEAGGGEYERAAAEFTYSIQLNPTRVEAFARRGDVLRVLGRTEAALADYSAYLSCPAHRRPGPSGPRATVRPGPRSSRSPRPTSPRHWRSRPTTRQRTAPATGRAARPDWAIRPGRWRSSRGRSNWRPGTRSRTSSAGSRTCSRATRPPPSRT